MAYYGGDPLGLNWMPMLALYSSLGNKSNTHAQNCQIGSQLQKLDGKDRIVIEGISSKIDQLIQRNNVSVGRDEMKALKDSIVKELGTIASQYGNQSSGPVVCDANSLVFDEDVKSLLSELVREKASGLTRNVGQTGEESAYMIGQKRILYFNHGLYSKQEDELVFMFRNSSTELTIPSVAYRVEGKYNTTYASFVMGIEPSRRFIDRTKLETWGKAWAKKNKKSISTATMKDLKNLVTRREEGELILNDIELLRVIHTELIDI